MHVASNGLKTITEQVPKHIVGWIIGILIILFFFSPFAIVPAGTVGIIDTFGAVADTPLQPGFAFKLPISAVSMMDTKTLEMKESMSTATSEGLIVTTDVSLLYHIDSTKAVTLYKTVGPEYTFENVLISPNLRAAVRDVIAKYETKDLYSGKREFLAQEIQKTIEPALISRGIIVETILMRNLELPDQVKQAIEQKLKAEQEAQQMQFVLDKERKEAERKVIEAEGIKQSQEIINKTLTREYLQYLWISKLNENQHVIYVPIDSQGVTLFRNVDAPTP